MLLLLGEKNVMPYTEESLRVRVELGKDWKGVTETAGQGGWLLVIKLQALDKIQIRQDL